MRTEGERLHGLDQAAFVGMMMAVGYPLLDQLAKQIAGNQQATFERSGDAKVVQNFEDYLHGKKNLRQVFMSTFSPGMLTAPLELGFNTNFYTGGHIFKDKDLIHGRLLPVAKDIGKFGISQIAPAQNVLQNAEGEDTDRQLENQFMIDVPKTKK